MKDRPSAVEGSGPSPSGGAWAPLDADRTAQLVAAASDLALLIDDAGVIRNLSITGGDASLGMAEAWLGKRFVDTVTSETRPKAEALLRDSALHGVSVRRQLNHVSPDGADLPVSYATVRLAGHAGTIAVGRDLRTMSTLQHRLVETQQEMERSYWRLRHTETRYRLLFHHSAEAVVVVDSATRRIVDANAAAGRFLGHAADQLVGRAFPFELDADATREVNDLLVTARMSGRVSEADVAMGDGRGVRLSVSCFRQEAATLYFVRLLPAGTGSPSGDEELHRATLELLEVAPDAVCLADADGLLVYVNRAFLDLCQLNSPAQAIGRPLSEWIGRPGADVGVMLATLRQHGAIRLLQTAARGEHGATSEVELSAVAAPGQVPFTAFLLRDVSRRVTAAPQGARDLTRAVEQLTDLVGRVSLPDLLRDTVDLVERHFVEAALVLTGDNRTAAAELLGLSRQSLYIKLRRHKLVPADTSEAEVSD